MSAPGRAAGSGGRLGWQASGQCRIFRYPSIEAGKFYANCLGLQGPHTLMTAAEIAAAKKTAGRYTCMLCLYTGPLAYGPCGAPLCQACQSGSPDYLIPNCPACGGIVRVSCERRDPAFQCPTCGKRWDEPRV